MSNQIKPETYSMGRPVVHFLNILTDEERESVPNDINRISRLYVMAQNKARDFGGIKFHNRSFGGGIVFPSIEHLNDLAQTMD